MKQLQVNNREILLVEVPEDAEEFYVFYYCETAMSFQYKIPGQLWSDPQPLPDGHWNIEGKPSKFTEELWKPLVGMEITLTQKGTVGGYKDYLTEEPDFAFVDNATESGHSLLKANGFSPETVIVLIKDI